MARKLTDIFEPLIGKKFPSRIEGEGNIICVALPLAYRPAYDGGGG
jgi:hypothetical protein